MAKAETNTAGAEDQSMEEILQSIRRIIAEEGENPEGAPAAPSNAEADVLELTDVVMESGAVVNINETQASSGEIEFEPIAAAPASGSDDVLANIDSALQGSGGQAVADSLLSPAAAEAASQALRHLRRPQAALSPIDSASFRSGATVEDLVVESLKPMLKEWLDANLPTVVERIVEREIKKLS